MMIPRYPRLDQHHSPNATENIVLNSVLGVGNYGLISGNYSMNVTLTETSIVEVVFSGSFNHTGNVNAWRWYMCRLQETSVGTTMALGGSFDYHGAIGVAQTGAIRGESLTGMIQLAAGGPYTFETQVTVGTANTWQLYLGHMHIKIIRP